MQLESRVATQVRGLFAEIRHELDVRGIHSQKFDDATDQLETIVAAYVEPAAGFYDWSPFRPTGKERQILDLLHARLGQTVLKESINNALYYDRPNSQPEIKIIDVFMCRLRRDKGFGEKPIAPFQILTDWGHGYRMIRRPAPEPLYNALDALSAAQ